ncbi:MAG: pilus assembly protein PilM [Thermoguttaceae bacterium]|nr:pilus assembly protein PilM [Thermoguttaceae bacterium]
MAKNEIVWGIDVGNTSLKALRCQLGDEPGTLRVLAFDYIEHNKVMSQPGADPKEILAESLRLFLSRNDVKGERIAVSVSGQSALWRFQSLPPVEPKKIKDLVQYEVRQWLPFNLDDVIWTYREVGGVQEGSILLDANIFMYAMKKELANKTIASYAENNIEIDAIQGAPIALYNSYVHNFYGANPPEADGAGSNQYDLILNVGTDTSEVVITNGTSIWLRNIPIGGNAFTKALTKSLKLTFSNAEHIKRNAAQSPDVRAVIVAMRPVFTEMQSEIERSIKYYNNLNRNAVIRRIYAMGSAMKLPGLRNFLAKTLNMEVVLPTSFDRLQGPEVLNNPQFRENISSFAVAYGLALQLLHQGTLDVNLIPPEVVRDRLVNSKKPWALAAAALLLLAFALQYISSTSALATVRNSALTSAVEAAKRVHSESDRINKNVKDEIDKFKKMDVIGKTLTSNVEGRVTWIELIKTINAFLKIPEGFFPDDVRLVETLPPEFTSMNAREKAEAISNLDRIYIDNIEVVPVDDLSTWFEQVRKWYTIDDIEAKWFEAADQGDSSLLEENYAFPEAPEFGIAAYANAAGGGKGGKGGKGAPKAKGAAKKPAKAPAAGGGAAGKGKGPAKGGAKGGPKGKGGSAAASDEFVESKDPRLELITGPSGAGNIVQLTAYHYHNSSDRSDSNRGPEYVRRRFLPWLKHGYVQLPVSLEQQRQSGGAESQTETVSFRDFGIFYPVMINPGQVDENYRVLDPEAAIQELNKTKENNLSGRTGSTAGNNRGGAAAGTGALPGMPGGMPGMPMMGGMPGMPGGMPIMPMMGGNLPGLGTVAQNMSQNNSEKVLQLRRFDFTVQFVWQETPPSIREERIAEKAANQKEGDDKGGKTSPGPPGGAVPAPNNTPAAPSAENAPAAEGSAPAAGGAEPENAPAGGEEGAN